MFEDSGLMEEDGLSPVSVGEVSKRPPLSPLSLALPPVASQIMTLKKSAPYGKISPKVENFLKAIPLNRRLGNLYLHLFRALTLLGVES